MNGLFFLLEKKRSRIKNVWYPQGTVMDATETNEQLMLQEPNVLYDSGAQILSGSVFKMWYSAGYASRSMHYAESTDGVNWVKYSGNPVLANKFRSYVFKNGANYIMYSQGGGLQKYSSANGIAWSLDGTCTFTPSFSGWESGGSQNICVWIEGATWYMLYEAGDGSRYQIGLATSPDGLTWTKNASNPVLAKAAGSISGPFVQKINGQYVCWAHISASGTLPTDFVRYKSSDLVTWTQSPVGFTLPRTAPDEGAGSAAGQVADISIVEVGGVAYALYAAYQDGSTASGHINLATAQIGFTRLAQSSEGLSTAYAPNRIQNPGFERAGAGGADVFAYWSETAGTGAIAQTRVAGQFRSGVGALKLTAGSSTNTLVTQQATGLVVGKTYEYSGWARGDGVNGPRIRVFFGSDLLTPSIPVLSSSTTFTRFAYRFVANNTAVVIYCYCPAANGGIGYFDDISVKLVE